MKETIFILNAEPPNSASRLHSYLQKTQLIFQGMIHGTTDRRRSYRRA